MNYAGSARMEVGALSVSVTRESSAEFHND